MKTLTIHALFLLMTKILFCQKIVINPKLKTKETKIETKEFQRDYLIDFSYEKKYLDTIEVGFSKQGTGGTGIKFFLTDTIAVKAFIWADYGKFDGKSEVQYDPKYMSLKLNKTKFSKGDTLMGKIQLLSNPILYREGKPERLFIGDFFHVLR